MPFSPPCVLISRTTAPARSPNKPKTKAINGVTSIAFNYWNIKTDTLRVRAQLKVSCGAARVAL